MVVTDIIIVCFSESGISIISFLPVLYTLFYVFPGNILRSNGFLPGVTSLNIFCFMRYFLYPVILMVSNLNYSNNGYLVYAEWLFIYEMLIITVTIYLAYRQKEQIQGCEMITSYEGKHYIPFAIIILTLGIIVLNPSIVDSYNFIFTSGQYAKYNYEAFNNSINIIIVNMARLLLMIVIINELYKKYLKLHKNIYIILTYIIAFIVASVIRGTSRGSAIIPLLVIAFLMLNLYKEHRKKTIIICLSLLVVVVVVTTMQKSLYGSNIYALNEGPAKWIARYLGSYYGSFNNISYAIEAKSTYGNSIGLSTLLNDIFYGVPFVNHFMDGMDRSTIYYNLAYYNGAQIYDSIVPTIGQGYIYFGYILSPIFSVLLIVVLHRLDRSYSRSYSIWKKFLLGYIAVLIGSTISGNISIIIAQIMQVCIPIYLLFWIEEFLSSRKRKNTQITHKILQ